MRRFVDPDDVLAVVALHWSIRLRMHGKEEAIFSWSLMFGIISCILVLLSRESDQMSIRTRLGVAGHLSTTVRWRNVAKHLWQRHSSDGRVVRASACGVVDSSLISSRVKPMILILVFYCLTFGI